MANLREQYEAMAEAAQREQAAVELRAKLAETHRVLARTRRKFESAAERKGTKSWERVIRACQVLGELESIDRQLTALGTGVKGLPFRAARKLLPELKAQAHSLLLQDAGAVEVASGHTADAYEMARTILHVAGKRRSSRKAAHVAKGLAADMLTGRKTKSAKRGSCKRTVPTRPAKPSAERLAMLGDDA